MKLALIACSKSKLDRPAPARDLYQGQLFKRSVQYVEQVIKVDHWFILSAKFGLLHPDTVIGPYDMTLNNMTIKQRDIWAMTAYWQWKMEMTSLPFNHFHELWILAGAAYQTEIEHYPLKALHKPLEGMGIGQRTAWLKGEIDRCRS